VYHARERYKICIVFLSERLKRRNNLEELGIGDRIILKGIFKKHSKGCGLELFGSN
jgi:hypothetical protein